MQLYRAFELEFIFQFCDTADVFAGSPQLEISPATVAYHLNYILHTNTDSKFTLTDYLMENTR
jgi:hypothetical protein